MFRLELNTLLAAVPSDASRKLPEPLLVISRSDRHERNLAQFENGLLAVHSGAAEYEQKPVLRGLLGGVFAWHPDQCPVTINPRMEHPLCAESGSFTLQDEHYFMALDDPEADVFVTTTSVNGEQPGAWRRELEHGRVAVLTPGPV